MIHDLVSPWCTALESADTERATHAFRSRHAALLRQLQIRRTDVDDEFPLADSPHALKRVARQAADPAFQQSLRELLVRAASLGMVTGDGITLLASRGVGAAWEALTSPPLGIVLMCDALDDTVSVTASAQALAALTRWTAPESASAIVAAAPAPWSHWELARTVPLREWIYTAGVGAHLAAALNTGMEPHALLGVSHTAFGRLREREKTLRELLETDLDACGIGLHMRWLSRDSTASARTVARQVIPDGAGHYLAWRMTAERVRRVGLGEAVRMES